MVEIDEEDALDRIGKVKIEATSFTLSDPHAPVEVSFLIYDLSTPEEQKELRDVYGIHPFLVDTMTLERIFSDKVFAAESYYVRNRYEDVAKHMYDVAIMLQLPAIQKWLEDSETAYNTLIPRWEEEKRRLDSILDDKPFSDYTLFNACTGDEALKKGFDKMQRIYVYQEKYLLEYSWVCEQWQSIYPCLLKIDKVRKKKEATAASYYTLHDLQQDPSTLMAVMQIHWNYAEWFQTKFPNGAPSKEAVLNEEV